jgi:hypothetical protein
VSSPRERWLPLLFALLALAATAPAFAHPGYFAGAYDWRYFESWLDVGRRTVLWWHQVPLWNPYGCGGEVLLANPQSMVASPAFLLVLAFGTALGIKLMIAVYHFCAFDGMYRLARSYQLTVGGALLASMLFGAGGWLALHVSSGHANFASAALFPYFMWCYRRARAERIWVIPLGALAAWVVADGGTSTPAMAMVLMTTLAAIDAVKERSAAPFLVLALAAGVGVLVGAARFFPTLEFAVDHPRHQWETDANTVWHLVRSGYWWRGVEPVPGKRYWFHEYGWRLSWLTPPLILWSLTVRKTRALWILVAVGAGIAAGSAWPYGPWWLLKHLPLFRDLRVPSRYVVLFALAFPLLCGAALDDLVGRLRAAPLRVGLTVAVVALAAADGLAFDWFCYRAVFNTPVEAAGRGAPFYQIHGDWRGMMNYVLDNLGDLSCDEEAPLQRAEQLDVGQVPQVKLVDLSAGTVGDVRWTPNRVEVELALERPSIVLFNQNWNEHWKTTVGEIVKYGPKVARDRDGGRLAVAAPAGRYRLAVYYRPRSFVVGVAVSGLAIPLLIALWCRRRVAG